MIGKTISHYKIIEKLGEGGMGVVYKAEDTKLDRFVALKFLPPHVATDAEEKQRFIHEAKAASSLQHNNICTIFEINEIPTEGREQMFICMDYYDGETLKDKIQRGPLKLEEAIDTVIQITQGLARAHEEKIVHRDIKPANVIVTKRDVVKIVDFGLAKLAGRTKLTKSGTTLGTAAYMSPEQTRGEKVDHRSDIWSLGVVLYEMITGQLPFKGDYEQAVVYSIVNEEPEPMTGLRTGLPIELERVVTKALAKKPDERYQHVDEMLVDLKNLRKGFETSGVIRPVEVAESHPRKRLKKLIIPVGAILILILAFFMLRSFLMEEVLSSAPVAIAVIPFENRTGDAEYNNLSIVIQDLLITKLGNSEYLDVTTRERMHDIRKQMGKENAEITIELGFDLCRFDGVEAVVVGSIAKAGDTFVTDVKVLNVESKALLESASSKGKGVDSILDNQIDELGRKISRIVGLSERKVEATQKSIKDITTTSTEAYNYFIKGRDEFERYDLDDAKPLLEKAVEIDSTFALAYRYLAVTHWRLQEASSERKAWEKAKRFSGKTTEKERLWIDADYAFSVEHDQEKQIRILEEITKKYPKEKRAHWNLGWMYWITGLYSKAVEECKKALDLDPNYGDTWNILGNVYSAIGDFDGAIASLKRYAEVSPGDPNPFDTMGEVYFRMGNLEEAMANYKKAFGINPDFLGEIYNIGYVYALMSDYTEALKCVDQGITETRSLGWKARGYFQKGFYHYWLGSLSQALSDLNTSEGLYNQIKNEKSKAGINWLKAWIYYDKGDFELSRKYLKSWFKIYKPFTPSRIPICKHNYNFHLGLIDLQQDRIDSVKSRLNEMKLLLPEISNMARDRITFYSDLLNGEILLAENSAEKAIDICRKESPLDYGITHVQNWLLSMCMNNLLIKKDVLMAITDWIEKREQVEGVKP